MESSTMIRGPSTPFVPVGASEPPRAMDQLTPQLAEDLIELLGEAGVEIFNACGKGNPVAARLRSMRDRIETSKLVVEGRQ